MLHRQLLPFAVSLVLIGTLAAGCNTSGSEGGEPTREPRAASRKGIFGDIPGIVREVEPSVVTILAETAQGEGQGSGVSFAVTA